MRAAEHERVVFIERIDYALELTAQKAPSSNREALATFVKESLDSLQRLMEKTNRAPRFFVSLEAGEDRRSRGWIHADLRAGPLLWQARVSSDRGRARTFSAIDPLMLVGRLSELFSAASGRWVEDHACGNHSHA